MTWQTIAASETDANSPLNQTLLDKIRGNLDALHEGAAVLNSGLKTSTQEVSVSSGGAANLSLSAVGSYGFYPQVKKSGSGNMSAQLALNFAAGSSYVTSIYLDAISLTAFAQVRYVQASRDEPVVWLLREKSTGAVLASVFDPEARGDDHPFLDHRKDGAGLAPELEIVALELKRDDRLRLHLFTHYQAAGQSWLTQVHLGLLTGALKLKAGAGEPRLTRETAPCLHAPDVRVVEFEFSAPAE